MKIYKITHNPELFVKANDTLIENLPPFLHLLNDDEQGFVKFSKKQLKEYREYMLKNKHIYLNRKEKKQFNEALLVFDKMIKDKKTLFYLFNL